jgi:hypothetical protein
VIGVWIYLGAVLVHPYLFLSAFTWGACFGCHEVHFLLLGPEQEHIVYGKEGGWSAVSNLVFFYVAFGPAIPLLVSLGGAALGRVVEAALTLVSDWR